MAVLILVVAVIIVGVVIALRSGPPQDQSALSSAEASNTTLGLWCLVSGLVALFGVAMIGQATYEWVSGFDPPGWLRIVTAWMFPIGVIASAILGALSLKRNSARMLGITGLALAVLSTVAFFAILLSVDY
jgi:Mn2+/Fe2+ NRAMP family transporter